MSVKYIAGYDNAESIIAYIARVSNPANQDNPNIAGLLKYCMREGHWSVFEQGEMTLEIKTTRDIAAQILRHNSFRFQEFSQRYAAVTDMAPIPELRLQDHKNRQNSIEPEEGDLDVASCNVVIEDYFARGMEIYNNLLKAGVAKECARKVLPLNTPTTMYMKGDLRSWIHYINLRSGNGTQKEHRIIAEEAKAIFIDKFPTIAEAAGWV